MAGQRLTWLEGHCVAYGDNVPYHPLLELLRTSLHIEEGDSALQIHEKLRQGLRRPVPPQEELLPFLGELCGVTDASLAHLHPDLKQWKTFEPLRMLTTAESQRQPQVASSINCMICSLPDASRPI
jgi:hypothetical protein